VGSSDGFLWAAGIEQPRKDGLLMNSAWKHLKKCDCSPGTYGTGCFEFSIQSAKDEGHLGGYAQAVSDMEDDCNPILDRLGAPLHNSGIPGKVALWRRLELYAAKILPWPRWFVHPTAKAERSLGLFFSLVEERRGIAPILVDSEHTAKRIAAWLNDNRIDLESERINRPKEIPS
jgi:hypothetical protein